MGIMMLVMLLAQLPNLLMNPRVERMVTRRPTDAAEADESKARLAEEKTRTVAMLDWAHRYIPLLWLPLGARTLAEGHVWPAMLGACGMFAIGVCGLACAYRGTLRFYQGGENKKPVPTPVVTPTANSGKKILLEWTLPAIPEEAATMALARLRSRGRAPEVKMALAMNVMIFFVIGAGVFLRRTGPGPALGEPLSATIQSLVAGGVVAVTFFGLMQLMFNHFGFDRDGFRAIVLLPTPRRHILLGKNLALLPVALAVFAVYLGLAAVLAHLCASAILTACIEFGTAFLTLSVLGNLASILAPYRITAGSLKPTKMKGITLLLILATQMLFPLALLPVSLPAGLGLLCDQMEWLPGAVVTPISAVLLAGGSALVYWYTLEPVGKLLQRREQRILQTVTQEVE
jgi:hypothetical protein